MKYLPPVIDADKANHDFYGSTIQTLSLLLSIILYFFTAVPISLVYYSIVLAVLIAWAKEVIIDKKMGKGTYSVADFNYTVLGALKVYVPAALLVYLLSK